jgi:hypothetical protein
VITRSRSDDPSGPKAGAIGHCLPAGTVDALATVADRLRRLPESRLSRAAESARDLVQLLADAAAGVEGRAGSSPPELRAVPALSVFSLGDQVAVTARELAEATTDLDVSDPVWWRGTRRPWRLVCDELHAAVEGLRALV